MLESKNDIITTKLLNFVILTLYQALKKLHWFRKICLKNKIL